MNTNSPNSETAKAPCACNTPYAPLSDDLLQKPEPCCGQSREQEIPLYDKPGYQLCSYVENFLDTSAGPVPRIKTTMDFKDHLGTIMTRSGINRDNYRVAPGLYAVGKPDENSPVLFTANYKLSVDHLRKVLSSLNVWIVVVDTFGINVWCAAGKGTFSSDEVAARIKKIGLDKIVKHREIILPQLSATGVSAHQVRKQSGFKVIWGPVMAKDIADFINAGNKADSSMRKVTFSFLDRLVLVPVELSLVIKNIFWLLLALFILSGIGPGIFSLGQALNKGGMALAAAFGGIAAGAILTPVLLPWIPGRAFSLKGALVGLILALFIPAIFWDNIGAPGLSALFLLTIIISSYLAMNFTGATPFTSPSGVEKEMRKAIPVQALAGIAAVTLWIGDAFTLF